MKLLTKAIEKLFSKTGRQEDKLMDAKVIAKFFNPCGSRTWLATEYEPMDRIFFGYVTGMGIENEWGYFSLDELQKFTGKLGLGIERDMWFRPALLKDVLEKEKY